MFNYLKNSKYSSKKINKIYSDYLYTGIHGVLMRYCHRQLETKLPNKNFKKILEIGAGSQPHLPYIKGKDFSSLKERLSEKLVETISPIGKNITKLMKDKKHLEDVLKKGQEKANNIAEENLKKIREIVGFV